MNNEYWKEFYNKKLAPMTPSSFAKNLGFKGRFIFDVGAGNGRDSVFFAKNNTVISIDPEGEPYKKTKNLSFLKIGIEKLVEIDSCKNYVCYSRFLLHAIPKNLIKKLIDWNKGLFVAEFRIKGDKPIIYKDHKRTTITIWEVLSMMKDKYEILCLEQGRGMAKYKNEDPLVCRIIAKRK